MRVNLALSSMHGNPEATIVKELHNNLRFGYRGLTIPNPVGQLKIFKHTFQLNVSELSISKHFGDISADIDLVTLQELPHDNPKSPEK